MAEGTNMLRTLALLGMAGALAGCDLIVQAAEDRAAAEVENMASNLSLDLPGDVKAMALETLGVPMIAGATVTGVNVKANGLGAPTINLAFNAPVAPDDVKTYFVDQFRQQGIAANLAADALTGTAANGAAFTMRFKPQGGGTSGTIEIDPPAAR
jgi:hypothetical protein